MNFFWQACKPDHPLVFFLRREADVSFMAGILASTWKERKKERKKEIEERKGKIEIIRLKLNSDEEIMFCVLFYFFKCRRNRMFIVLFKQTRVGSA